MGIWSCVGLRQESVQKSLLGEVGTDYCSQWGSKQSLRCKPDRRGFKVVEGGLASGTDHDNSLTLSLTSDTLPDMVLKSLVDSGSSDSFIDSVFVQTQHLPAYGIPPIKL